MSEIKLLPCPFCGGSKLYIWERNYFSQKHSTVSCIECHVSQTGDGFKTREEAIKSWNTRKPMQEILERLENESRYSEEAKEYARVNNPLQFERCDSYLSAIDNAIQIVREVGGIDG